MMQKPAGPVPDEQPLPGGNVSAGVVRVGDTVRRPAGPWTPAVHAFLDHLRGAGFDGAPRPLGIDERGREVLSFAPGVVPWPDRFELLEPAARLTRVGRMIRDLHDAAEGFVPPPDARWQVLIPDGDTHPDADKGSHADTGRHADADSHIDTGRHADAGIVVHHDLAPWNLVVGDRWVFIDWDCAAPGSRLWDLAYAAHGFVPLSADPRWSPLDAAGRLRILADGYRLDETHRRRLVPLLARRTRSMYDFLARESARGTEPWSGLWRDGHGESWRADAEHIARHEERWLTALLD